MITGNADCNDSPVQFSAGLMPATICCHDRMAAQELAKDHHPVMMGAEIAAWKRCTNQSDAVQPSTYVRHKSAQVSARESAQVLHSCPDV